MSHNEYFRSQIIQPKVFTANFRKIKHESQSTNENSSKNDRNRHKMHLSVDGIFSISLSTVQLKTSKGIFKYLK